jgi:2-keto-myo-inositol isomerase
MSTTRRHLLAGMGAATALGCTAAATGSVSQPAAQRVNPHEPFGYCLNTSTLRGHKLPLVEEVEIAAESGYQANEPWVDEIRRHQEGGGALSDLRKRIADLGLNVVSAIGFANWIVDDDRQRAQGLETARHDMQLVQQIGGTRIAAPPAGATNQTNMDLRRVAERYRALLEVGSREGVVPELELWGFSKTLGRLGEVAYVVVECGHPQACLLPDVFHVYKGGSDFNGFRLLSGRSMFSFHMNDYPAEPPRETISDADRVYPGDGVAPLGPLLQGLAGNGYQGVLSLELFNHRYWMQDPREVARTGLAKMRQVVQAALS